MGKRLAELQELAERDGADGGASGSTGESDDAVAESTATDDAGSTGSRSLLGRTPFSAKGFLLTLAALVGGLVVGSAVPLIGGLTRYLGLFAAAFLLGLGRSRRAYLETAVAGALAAGGAFLLGTLTSGSVLLRANLLAEYGLSPAGAGATLAGVGVSVGVLLSVAGVYFGRDLRAGLTRAVE
ncbi:hypothetical protein [Halobaculum gomorrense]|uniref:Uncharacterized protein n=1 Tax=Halobaculum gomorrense TaxID=43928 RepID=A0A1M5KX10_9EURY|nr:hypothetical protein [Halobaculum gomorrense]SHG57276.1 hypothetical protein SAMN05443636_0677 [Halobaculum gomorrense]